MESLLRRSPEIGYIALLFALFIVPRLLQRFRLPTAITAVALGAATGVGLGLFVADPTVQLLSTFGIVSLFLFAGLDVDLQDLRTHLGFLTQHLVIGVVAVLVVAFGVHGALGIALRPSLLVALALLTPSTGFILDSLGALDLDEQQQFWVKSKAVATEVVALGTLFVTLQSTTVRQITASTALLGAMIVVLPLVFRYFATKIAPSAPKSEFAFLVMIAVLCAYATHKLGVYYLVGAFVVGVAAQRFREQLPAIASDQMLHAVEVFASLFVPFYFFAAGLALRREDFGLGSLAFGAVTLVTILPARLALVALHRRIALGEGLRQGARIATALLPTLVFTLVIAKILRDRFDVPKYVFGGLMVYTLVNTMIPGLFLHLPPPDFSAPHWLVYPRRKP